jgi:glycosyltransferase involved in cell wall biosynthesis
MRVVHVAPTAFGAAGLFGGGERYPLELARAMAAHVDCELITFARFGSVQYEPSGLRIRTLAPIALWRGHLANPIAPTLPFALRGARVIHTHHLRTMPSRIAAVTGRFRGARLAVTDHGMPGSLWGGLLPRLFDDFLAVSAYSARELAAPERKTRVIYGGADPLRFTPDATLMRHGVLFVGRLTPHKGVDRLLQALPGDASLRIVGSTGHDSRPPETDYPRLLQHLAQGHDVQFLGAAHEADLPALYRAAQVLVLPSVHATCYGRTVRISELLGLTLLEAMASGTPVIASRVGGIPEIVQDGETGFLVPPGDVTVLRERISQLVRDKALAARMGERARESVLDRFTWQHVAERCLAAYSER